MTYAYIKYFNFVITFLLKRDANHCILYIKKSNSILFIIEESILFDLFIKEKIGARMKRIKGQIKKIFNGTRKLKNNDMNNCSVNIENVTIGIINKPLKQTLDLPG